MSGYVSTIGLEVHVQLRTQSKMFCGCSTRYGAAPNTQVCPVCLGYPGTLPVMNEEAVRLTVLTGLMIGSRIRSHSKFDRKSYFYPDMPKNYQISQYDRPLCEGGSVEIETDAGVKTVGITRIHLEEDVGKSFHFAQCSGLDFNRAGVPLMEIVSEPDLASPAEAYAYLSALKQILLYAGVSDCNLEEGNVRCDVNCSVRPPGQATLGTKIEIKNLNTFKGVQSALEYELNRQAGVLTGGGRLEQETRRWDSESGVTLVMRTKEQAHDYRYFPDPDLAPVALPAEQVAAWRAALPELPRRRRERFVKEYGLPEYDAGVLTADAAVADYFEAAAKRSGKAKAVSNWVMTEMLRWLSESGTTIREARVTPQALADLVDLVERGVINTPSAKEVLGVLFAEGGDPRRIVEARGLGQISDFGALEQLADQAIEANPKSVADYRGGKKEAAKILAARLDRKS